jgi:hypothetical protein
MQGFQIYWDPEFALVYFSALMDDSTILMISTVAMVNVWYFNENLIDDSILAARKLLRSKKGRLVQHRRYTPPALRHQPPRNGGLIVRQMDTIYEST